MPVGLAIEQELQAEVAAGDAERWRTAARRPSRSSGTAASHSTAPALSRSDQVRRRAEPVLVERVAADGQRVVDPDRLARDLAAVLVDGEVGREVGGLARVETGRLEVDVLDQQQAGRPDRAGRSACCPRPRRGPAPRPRREVTAAAIRNRMRPRWVSSVAILVYWWRSPYTKRVPSSAVASRTWKPLRRRTAPDVAGRHAVHRGPIGQARIEVRLGLGDPDVADAAPQAGRPVERAHDDRHDRARPARR